jgi:hypothetical protein
MGRNTTSIIVIVILLLFVALLTVALSTTNCPSLFFCSPDPTALFLGILFAFIVFGTRLVADLAGGRSKSEPPPND